MTGPNIPPLPRERWTDDARDVFAYWEGDEARQNGSRSNTMLTLAQHPKLAMATLDFGKYFMLESTLSARQIKLVILRVAHRNGATYQWTHNAYGALQIGISETEIEAVKQGPSSPVWNPDERAMLELVDAVASGGTIDPQTWQAASASFDTPFIMDILHATGYFAMIGLGLKAMGVEIEPDFAEFSRNRAKS